jgi:Type IV secretory system Conjugative DNA transfer
MTALLILVSFAACVAGGWWVLRGMGAAGGYGDARALPAAVADDPWVARTPPVNAGTHVYAGRVEDGVLWTPPDSAAIIVGPPRSGKTRKVIAPTLAAWAGPAFVTSTKGDILQSAQHRSGYGPVALYDPTGSLGQPESCVGFTPLSRCGTWDGAVEVAAALLSPASSDETVRHGEHFAIAARALLAPLFHAAELSGGGMDRARGWLGRSEFSEPSEILRAGVREMARVKHPGGIVASCVWDYAAEMTLLRAFWDAAREVDPERAAAADEGVVMHWCAEDELAELWRAAGLRDARFGPLVVSATYTDFQDLWSPFLTGVAPSGAFCKSLDEEHRAALHDAYRRHLGIDDGPFELPARAWAVVGIVRR